MLTEHTPRPTELALTHTRRHTLPIWLVALLIGGAALAPRLIGLADFYTIDEAYHWPMRVRLFTDALRLGNWAGTNLTGHPGVTTMWLGTIGRWLAHRAGVTEPGYADGAAFLAYLRMPLAIVNSVVVALGYAALRRLVRPSMALLAGLLWAFSPFIIAHSRLLHLDALLTSFMTLSLLLLLVAIVDGAYPATGGPGLINRRRSTRFDQWALIASGVCMGLALLTKAPSLILLPFAGLLLLGLSPRGPLWSRVRWTLTRYMLWLGCAVLIFFVGWPAMWAAPQHAIGAVINEVIINGGQPTDAGNYFMGQPVAAPGWLFYPAVVLWRTTPLTLLGLVLFPLALWRQRAERRVLISLLSFALFFGVTLSIEPKKFDRYLLPIWPALEILAAAGLLAAAEFVWQLFDRKHVLINIRRRTSCMLGASVTLFLIVTDLAYHPYYLAYYNPLLGGGATAQRVMLVGWGEGLEQVGAWLNQRPDVRNGPILSWIPPALVHFVPQQVNDLTEQNIKQPSSYAVLYSRSVQRKESAVAEAYARQTPALYTLRMYGIEYASVHQLPRPFTEPIDAVFGDGLHLRGFSHEVLQDTLVITPSWDIQRDQAAGVFFFVHVLAANGTKVAQVDLPIDDGMFSTWQAGQQFGRPLTLPWPASLPPGEYRVVLGVYNPADGHRLALTQGTALPDQIDGPGAIQLTTITRR